MEICILCGRSKFLLQIKTAKGTDEVCETCYEELSRLQRRLAILNGWMSVKLAFPSPIQKLTTDVEDDE